MARMIPSVFPRENNSSGEKEVFNYFDKKAPSDWIVLHSFRLPKHLKVVFGESDFIVVAPNYGVFTLEIKSGGVGYDGTDWLFINREHKVSKKHRGPFEQARDGMFEVEKIITQKLGDQYSRTKILYGYGVIFTDEDNFPVESITEDEPWRLIQNNVEKDYVTFIKRLTNNFRKELSELKKWQPDSIDKTDADKIVNALRPSIECVAPLKSFLDRSEEDIISLTEQQFNCLVDVEENDRVVVQGGAGTGKTIIALEDARRASEMDKKVAVICFNTNLAKKIRQSVDDKNITVQSFHALLTKICKDKIGQEDKTVSEYYTDILPQTACSVLDKTDFEKYDKLIVDEFQDLCTPNYLDCFDKILKGGLFEGNFTFYGDFARQAIFDPQSSLEVLKGRTFYANKKLTVNCRNTRNIGNELINVTGYEDKHYLLSISGEPVEYFSWEDPDAEKALLQQKISELRKKGIDSKSIVILSPRVREKSVVGLYDKMGMIIGNYGEDPNSYYAMFSTIQSFKGLESEVVILADIESYSDAPLMYVGLSRARSKMIVLESKAAAKQRKKLTIGRM